ncbi:MAG TPA: DNA-processing protein DprA [Burkholderiales bacterium]|nr:DNA-processing protein DprA [Burkholderiales bacterium]
MAGWLQLSLTPGLGAATLRELLRRFGLPEAVVAAGRRALSSTLSSDVLDGLYSEEVAQGVARALEWAQRPGHTLVALDDPAYPKALLEISDPPALLYTVGRVELLSQPALAVVGSRNATAQGARNAQAFARALSDSGLTIVSGLALGVDAAAHRGGLEGRNSTIAVLGTGVDIIYPPGNAALAREIAGRGLLVSEFALGFPATKQNFPRRNRVISGLTLGTLVVEAALSSGSLITARAALEQGREVFAVPGSIHSPLSKGCHSLIKSGAKLVESAEDVLSELAALQGGGPSLPGRNGISPAAATIRQSAEHSSLLEQMGFDPVDIDSLCARAGLSAQQVSAELLRLEMEGHVAALPGGLYQRLQS